MSTVLCMLFSLQWSARRLLNIILWSQQILVYANFAFGALLIAYVQSSDKGHSEKAAVDMVFFK